MRRSLITALCVASFIPALAAQSGPPATVDEAVVRQWTAVVGKVVAMAKDFPEEKFGYRPHPDVRTFREELWHVTATMEWLDRAMKGDADAAKVVKWNGEGRPADRAGIVAALESAANACAAQLKTRVDPRALAVLTHAAEDYGKLVVMYRANGLVPPQTRESDARRSTARGGSRP